MTETDDRFSAGGIVGRTKSGPAAERLWSGLYDLVICISGWDERCLAVRQASTLRATQCVIVLFDEKDRFGLRETHDKLLKVFAKSISPKVDIQTGPATGVRQVWTELLDRIRECYFRTQRPLSVFISASTCPRYHTLALLGIGLGQGFIKRLTIGYSDGIYPDASPHEIEVAFTGGTTEIVAVPGLEGTTEPGKRRFFLVSLGFEGWRTMRAVTRAEPDRVCVLLPDPGSSPDYVQRTLRDNRYLLEEFEIADDCIVRSHASDAIGTWKALAAQRVDRTELENGFYLCTGTKPHSIGLALRAMQLGSPAVLYSVPEEFRVVPIKTGSLHWAFDLVATATPAG
jgi:hypothetical protein